MTTPRLSTISTDRSWGDLVLTDENAKQIEEIKNWLKQFTAVKVKSFEKKKKLKPGYRSLFYGPPGTGKTLTAAIIGREFGLPVYKIDLSSLVSKYIGETEKNLGIVFERAEDTGGILFFDEADALFGKRTTVKEAHDKYANQQVSHLLERMEAYNGLVILATNMKSNIDEAFKRRFNSVIYFPIPEP